MSRHKNRIDGQWSPRLIEMLESPAYRALSVSAHRVISRIEIEHAHHGGNDNGRGRRLFLVQPQPQHGYRTPADASTSVTAARA